MKQVKNENIQLEKRIKNLQYKEKLLKQQEIDFQHQQQQWLQVEKAHQKQYQQELKIQENKQKLLKEKELLLKIKKMELIESQSKNFMKFMTQKRNEQLDQLQQQLEMEKNKPMN